MLSKGLNAWRWRGEGGGFVAGEPHSWPEHEAGLRVVEERLWEVRWAGMEDFCSTTHGPGPSCVCCGELPVLGSREVESGRLPERVSSPDQRDVWSDFSCLQCPHIGLGTEQNLSVGEIASVLRPFTSPEAFASEGGMGKDRDG